MAPYSSAQRSAVNEFVSFTKTDKSAAAKYLRNHSWNIQSAIAAYFSDPTNVHGGGSDLSKIFDQYRDDPKGNPNVIGMDGTQKYCQDIGVSVEDITFLVLSEIVQSENMGEISRDGFLDGWSRFGSFSLSSQAALIKNRTGGISNLTDRDTFKLVYRHTFKLFLQPPARSLDVETAILLWTILFSVQGLRWFTAMPNAQEGGVDWFELWTVFLRTKSKRPVNKDVWDQTLVFAEKVVEHGNISFWSEDGAWPGVIDEFVEWVKGERPDLDLGNNASESMDTR